jgi:hypothetical protein
MGDEIRTRAGDINTGIAIVVPAARITETIDSMAPIDDDIARKLHQESIAESGAKSAGRKITRQRREPHAPRGFRQATRQKKRLSFGLFAMNHSTPPLVSSLATTRVGETSPSFLSKEGGLQINAHFQIFFCRRISAARIFVHFRRLLRRQREQSTFRRVIIRKRHLHTSIRDTVTTDELRFTREVTPADRVKEVFAQFVQRADHGLAISALARVVEKKG